MTTVAATLPVTSTFTVTITGTGNPDLIRWAIVEAFNLMPADGTVDISIEASKP